jgi:hypothetical protein
MGEMKIQKPGVVPAINLDDCLIVDQENQIYTKTEGPKAKPAVGRLPARASRS